MQRVDLPSARKATPMRASLPTFGYPKGRFALVLLGELARPPARARFISLASVGNESVPSCTVVSTAISSWWGYAASAKVGWPVAQKPAVTASPCTTTTCRACKQSWSSPQVRWRCAPLPHAHQGRSAHYLTISNLPLGRELTSLRSSGHPSSHCPQCLPLPARRRIDAYQCRHSSPSLWLTRT